MKWSCLEDKQMNSKKLKVVIYLGAYAKCEVLM